MKTTFDRKTFFKNFSAKLLHLRFRLELSQDQMAWFWGIPETTYKDYESGGRNITTYNFLLLLTRLMNSESQYHHVVEIIEFFVGEKNMYLSDARMNVVREEYQKQPEADKINNYDHIPFVVNAEHSARMMVYLRKKAFVLSKPKLSQVLGISERTLDNYEHGRNKIGLTYLMKMCFASRDPIELLFHMAISETPVIEYTLKRKYLLNDDALKSLTGIPTLPNHLLI